MTNIKTKIILGIAALFSLDISAMNSHTNLTVGLISEGRPPYFFVDNGEAKGVYIDILDKISAETGIYIDYKFLPQARIRHYIKSQFIDIEPGIDPNGD